ncbi:MAG: ribonuclease P protein component [Burkholderiales bacterium]|nr:ribonuclease P protein component [Burkholderiales bacterium]
MQERRWQRLRKRYEYEAVFTHGRVVSSRLYVIRARPNNLSRARLGLVASRKALPRAVDRNRGKRLVREVFRQAQQDLMAMDIVVQLRAELVRQNNAAARRDLLDLFAGLGKNHDPSQPAGLRSV